MKTSIRHVSRLRRRFSVRLSFLAVCGATVVLLVTSINGGNLTTRFGILSNFLSTSRSLSNGAGGVPGETRGSTLDETTSRSLSKQYGKLPLGFEANLGQAKNAVRFI